MADRKPTSNEYNNLGGINLKASEYSTGKAQFLDIRNLDFDVPNALQKRPGSTFAMGSSFGTSGPITSLFEFIKLDGSSYVIAGSDTAMFYLTSGTLTSFSTGWSSGQPTDMLTFVNKLWMANGQKYESWAGAGSSALPAGLPCPVGAGLSTLAIAQGLPAGASTIKIAGMTMSPRKTGGDSFALIGMAAAYRYVRSDGYYGPLNILTDPTSPLAGGQRPGLQLYGGDAHPSANGQEYFQGDFNGAGQTGLPVVGFSTPAGFGISALALYLAVDIGRGAGGGNVSGDNGILTFYNLAVLGYPQTYVNATADESKFYLYTLLPAGTTLFYLNLSSGWTTAVLGSGLSSTPFSGMNFCWFDTYTPKYIEVNQNVMFMAGFSGAPSSVWNSEVGAPELIDSESNFEVRTNDGDRVFGIKAYANQVIILKENSFHKVAGDSPENFILSEISNEYGCISDKTIIEYKQKLLWLDKKGIVEFNGADWEIISNSVEAIFRRMNLSAAKDKAQAVHHLYRNQIWIGIPVDGATENNLTVVYDYLVGAWTFFDGFSASSFAYIKAGLNIPTAWRGDYSGLIHYTSASFYGDSGRGISAGFLTRFENYAGQNETSVWRRFFLDVAPVSGITGVITGQVYSNYDQSTVEATFTMYQNQFQTRKEMGVSGKSVAAQINHYSASLPLLINGYSWTKRPLRNV